MKISIITVCYNSADTLQDTLESVRSQDYSEIEHILIDGGSSDATVEIIKSFQHVTKWVSESDDGLYDAINKGIRMASGDVIGVLNSDDFFPQNHTVSTIAQAFLTNKVDAIYGDVAFVRPHNLGKVVRIYSSKNFTPRFFKYGYMPAHPSFYVKARCHHDLGLYRTDYKIAADYELLMRFFIKGKITSYYVPEVFVFMRTGGVSNKGIFSRYILNKEIVRACKENGVSTNLLILSMKYVNKIFEYIKPMFAVGK
jgi:glycosyltransferase involved in cell wall biosynthesis